MEEVILLEDVKNLGSIGSIVQVRPGYARNYLLPKQLARAASKKNTRQLEHDKRIAGFRRAKATAHANALKAKLESLQIKIARKVGEQDKLFGSVTTMDIQAALAAQDMAVDRHQLDLAEPIKALGAYSVGIRLAADIKTSLKVVVVAE